MRMDRLTASAQQALADAQSAASAQGHPEITGLHVLAALLEDRTSPATAIVSKAGADGARVKQVVGAELTRLPRVSGGGGVTGRAIMEVLSKADAESKRLGDSYVSSEHLLLAVASVNDKAKDLLSGLGLTHAKLEAAAKEIRKASGVERVDDPNAESNFEALKKYAIDLTERAQSGKLDPVIGRDEEI
ncbi:MAG: Clp protease N-terminal domain-containing protein, partial [Phycisphaerales bacterium]